jgi:hypothetical protein
LSDKVLVEEWKKTEAELFNEMGTVNDLRNIVKGLKVFKIDLV